MDKAILEMYLGKKIIIQWEHEIGEPKRKHKKKRIAKKWLKKYGIWTELEGACPKGRAIYFDNTLFVSKGLYIRIKNPLYYNPNLFKPIELAHHGNNFLRTMK